VPVDALLRLKRPERVARLRGKSVAEVLGLDEKKAEAVAPTPAAAQA
jgi:ribosomal protein L12E/L44/L45/RPP1/RPP2